jgi:triacylglycerol lipase
VAFNQKYPEGAPAIEGTAGTNDKGSNGVRYYSITGNANGSTNSLDPLDGLLLANSAKVAFQNVEADGLVQLTSQYWGKHLKTYPWNHLDEVNQSLGLLGKGAPSPKEVYRSLIQMLASQGL